MSRDNKVETSRTVLTTVRIPKPINNIMDLLVDAGVFKTKTEIINLALRRFLSEIFIALLAIDKMPISEYLSDPQKFKDLIKDQAFIEGSTILENSTYQIFLYYVVNLPQKIPPKKMQLLLDEMGDYLSEILGQAYFENIAQTKKKNSSKRDNVPPHVPDHPPRDDTSRGGAPHKEGGDLHEGV